MMVKSGNVFKLKSFIKFACFFAFFLGLPILHKIYNVVNDEIRKINITIILHTSLLYLL